MREVLFMTLLIPIVGCNHTTKSTVTFRDSIIQNYFSMVDSSGRYDTTDSHFKALKAYVQNDTAALKEIGSLISEKRILNRPNWELWNSDIPLPDLAELDSDEAYRFIHSISGSTAYEAITIFKRDSAIHLQYLFYQLHRETSTYDPIREFEKSVNWEQWKRLEEKIQDADFWGLKSEVNDRGTDGTDLTVIGLSKSAEGIQRNYVHRWTRGPVYDPFYFVYYQLLDKTEREYGK